MRLIDADAFDERVRVAGGMSEEELTEDFKDGVQAVLYMLSNQPTIQPEPHWISCSEKLPKTGQDVELCCGYKIFSGEMVRYICIAFHVNQYEMKADENWDEGCDEYREEDDEFYVSEGWYERIHNWDDYGSVKIYDEALAWRELPEEYRGE
jgi:hypothetical protein